mmetsp:Transcript_42948/g.93514  ORF Transcript_42948/g.93514 Transcript_42948/m.93514 type:complete len:550 (-) Transcript_42948:5-1654(-)
MSPRGGAERRCFSASGQLYFGDVIESANGDCLRHGHGLLVVSARAPSGEMLEQGRFKGSWKNDEMTGPGSCKWSDGSSYEGTLLGGQPHGAGCMTWPEGSIYDGAWLQGEMSGQGTFTDAFTGAVSQGIFYRNCFRRHDGSWADIIAEREEHRVKRLLIGTPHVEESPLPITWCTSEELLDRVLEQMASPSLVPLVLADASCPEAPEPGGSAAPLWCLEAPAVRWLRFEATALRGGDASDAVQLAQLAFSFEGEDISLAGASASNPGGASSPEEGPEMILDGSMKTRWLDSSKGALLVELPSNVRVDAFRFATGSEAPERDPVRWILQGSLDGVNWRLLNEQSSDFPTPLERLAWTEVSLSCTTDSTTMHVAFAAAEKNRHRDYGRIFRSALQESLLSHRVAAIAFGDVDPMPEAWSLGEFFGRGTLPLDIFDLRHFNGSGAASELVGSEEAPRVAAPPAASKGSATADVDDAPALSQSSEPPTAHMLRLALVCPHKLDFDRDDDVVRKHVWSRFAGHLPLQRISIIVVAAAPTRRLAASRRSIAMDKY